jgi:hypothetical protein
VTALRLGGVEVFYTFLGGFLLRLQACSARVIQAGQQDAIFRRHAGTRQEIEKHEKIVVKFHHSRTIK